MGYWDHSFEEVPCVFCGNKDAIRKLGNLGNYTIRCPACGNFFADISFIDDVAENGVLDSYILSGHARELSDGPPRYPFIFTSVDCIFRAGLRKKIGNHPHAPLMKYVPATRHYQRMELLHRVDTRLEDMREEVVEYGVDYPDELDRGLHLVPVNEFPICYARSPDDFHEILKEIEEIGHLDIEWDMESAHVKLSTDGKAALDEWRHHIDEIIWVLRAF
jgi:hypothetical protein